MNCEDYMRAIAAYPAYYARHAAPMMHAPTAQPAAYPVAYPTNTPQLPATVPQATAGTTEESYIENILRFNHGKIGTFYMTYQGNTKWNAMVFHGRVETAGRDHIIISDPRSGKRYLLLMSNLDWVEFDEKINYPFPTITPDVKSTLTATE